MVPAIPSLPGKIPLSSPRPMYFRKGVFASVEATMTEGYPKLMVPMDMRKQAIMPREPPELRSLGSPMLIRYHQAKY